MSLTHDKEQSRTDSQVFWLEVNADKETEANAQFRAWLAIGHYDMGDYKELSQHHKARWNMAYGQALQLEATKLAYKSEAIKWLIKQDAEIDIQPFTAGWQSRNGPTSVKVTIDNADDKAALAKLAFGGAQ